MVLPEIHNNAIGALYIDGTSGHAKFDDLVPPGGAITYAWVAANIHAPTKDDENCVPWGYHSHTNGPRDIATGLVGIALICRPGTLGLDGARMDVDRELVVYSDITDETNSWYINENIRRSTIKQHGHCCDVSSIGCRVF
ncbi:HPHL1-like protein [Mya arenaria]|uniref:HPHL1-like protein n=1 Tax=Mya arenaria TaxID=6604 RepID=A0ABY7FH95_MYAAR|nr:HPHL1-like protein [Mya arenaria]